MDLQGIACGVRGGVAAGVGAAGRTRALRAALDPAQTALLLALLSLLTAFILYPLVQVLAVALTADGHLSLVHLRNFFARPLFREALANSLLAGFLAVLFGSLLGVPLAYFSVRLQFRGRLLLQTLGVLPLAIPGVVLAVGYLRGLPRVGLPRPGWAAHRLLAHPGGGLQHAAAPLHGPGLRRRYAANPCVAGRGGHEPGEQPALGGLMAGGLIAFITSSVELSSTILLVAVGTYALNRVFSRGTGTAFKL